MSTPSHNRERQNRSDSQEPQPHPRAQIEQCLPTRRGLWTGAAAAYAAKRGES
jgi:hypothetical protein